MNKFIFALFVALAFVFQPLAALAQTPSTITVEFEQNPLFSEANFSPGKTITRSVTVTNNTATTQTVGTIATNVSDPDGLGSQLNLVISEGEDIRYQGTLTQFFTGEQSLSPLATTAQTTYSYAVTFVPESGNSYQGKVLGFDIAVGFISGSGSGGSGGDGGSGGSGGSSGGGGAGGSNPITTQSSSGGGGGGGGGFIGLIIPDTTVQVIDITTTSAVVLWTTNAFSTSQVIFAAENESFTFNLTPPTYGYPHQTVKDSTVTSSHRVPLTGLTPDTLYRFRVVSDADFFSGSTVSTEHTFRTLPDGSLPEVLGTNTGSGGAGSGSSQGNGSNGSPLVGSVADTLSSPKVARGSIGTGVSTRNDEDAAGSPQVLGTDVKAQDGTPVTNEKPCQEPWWWMWLFPLYLLLLLIEFYYLSGRHTQYWFVVPTLLMIAMLLWWYYPPCQRYTWYLPIIGVAVWGVMSTWYARRNVGNPSV